MTYIRNRSTIMELLVRAMLDFIRKELDRHYWNQNHKEMISPFDNTGEEYSNDYMTVRAYNWHDVMEDGDQHRPNFEAGYMRCYWYKHSNRGLVVEFEEGGHNSYDTVAETLQKCIESIEKDFNVSKE